LSVTLKTNLQNKPILLKNTMSSWMKMNPILMREAFALNKKKKISMPFFTNK
jgi:hypothetical protein